MKKLSQPRYGLSFPDVLYSYDQWAYATCTDDQEVYYIPKTSFIL